MTIVEEFDECKEEESYPKFEDKLYVISSIFSPFGQDIRTKLAQEFIQRLEKLQSQGYPVQVCIIELLYPEQESCVKVKNQKFYIQISYEKQGLYLFNKENLINIAVSKLLPVNWKYMAWIDADIEFINPKWSMEAITKLKTCDVLQLFSINRYLDSNGLPNVYFHSAIKVKNDVHLKNHKEYAHPGFAWAMTRKTYTKLRGLFEFAIVGGGDNIMCHSFLGIKSHMKKLYGKNKKFMEAIESYFEKAKGLRVEFLDTVIQHHYHGTRKNRMYTDRTAILIDSNYSPQDDLLKPFPELPLLLPTDEFYNKISGQITNYFQTRKEVS